MRYYPNLQKQSQPPKANPNQCVSSWWEAGIKRVGGCNTVANSNSARSDKILQEMARFDINQTAEMNLTSYVFDLHTIFSFESTVVPSEFEWSSLLPIGLLSMSKNYSL